MPKRRWLYRHHDSTPWRRLRYSLTAPRPARTPVAKVRMWWHDFVIHPLFEGGEICEDCGRSYVHWRAIGGIWQEVVGGNAGLLCPSCFDRRAVAKGILPVFTATVFRRLVPAHIEEEAQ